MHLPTAGPPAPPHRRAVCPNLRVHPPPLLRAALRILRLAGSGFRARLAVSDHAPPATAVSASQLCRRPLPRDACRLLAVAVAPAHPALHAVLRRRHPVAAPPRPHRASFASSAAANFHPQSTPLRSRHNIVFGFHCPLRSETK